MTIEYYAHSIAESGEKQRLPDHLLNVADHAREFARRFGAGDLGYLAGLIHDIGKFNPDFQKYLEHVPQALRVDHRSAGAILAFNQENSLIPFVVFGHHGGIPSRTDLKMIINEKKDDQAIETAIRQSRLLLPINKYLSTRIPPYATCSALSAEFFIRMLFSALVDADFLDTEGHFSPEKVEIRESHYDLQTLSEALEVSQNTLRGSIDNGINRIRWDIYGHCIGAAGLAPGVFSLTVPTGGGKTRSVMAFALKHAHIHGLERVIVAIPYLSIIEQTADVYRGIFGDGNVLEHHSAVDYPDDEDQNPNRIRLRLAAENWDAPIIVTTQVQLFESLFSHKTSRCRKLHNIANSVIILDEAQAIPLGYLDPIVDALKELVEHYRVSIVLSSATQPAIEKGSIFTAFPEVREIIPDPNRYFESLRRVSYKVDIQEKKDWGEIANILKTETRFLCVLNTKGDARALYEAIGDNDAFYLSTSLCGAHRRAILGRVRERLSSGQPCRLISTQCVEAGVDLDFPVVLRAVGPLDSIAQAAGRCNREGLLSAPGRVIIVDPAEGACPTGAYRTATDKARGVLINKEIDLTSADVFRAYFRSLYQYVDLDKKSIQQSREHLDFPEVSKRFRFFDEETVPVVVRYPPESDAIEILIKRLRSSDISRILLRRIQPYLVNIYRREVTHLEKDGLISPLTPDIYRWHGDYDDRFGITKKAYDPSEYVY